MSARFILSLDCEGKWGVADHLDRNIHATLTDQNLRWAYDKIIALLDEYAVPATFAFVGCFAEAKSALEARIDWLRSFEAHAPEYIRPALHDMSEGSGQGWHGDWAVDAVGGASVDHEIALHGVTHVPWTRLERSAAEDEMGFLREMDSPVRNSQTFIFPRNEVAHRDALATSGIKGYRKAPRQRSRLASLASEFNVFSAPETDAEREKELVAIPAGYFVNWRSGARRVVPIDLSVARARQMLNKAQESGGVVHYWLHPENIASAPVTLQLLRDIVAEAAQRRDAGRCVLMTQLEYVEGRQ